MQCLNEDVLQPMVSCVKRLPRIMAAEGLAGLWPGKAPSGTDLAGIIIGNDALNACRYVYSLCTAHTLNWLGVTNCQYLRPSLIRGGLSLFESNPYGRKVLLHWSTACQITLHDTHRMELHKS